MGTCLIHLKSWSDRKHNVNEIIKELEETSKDIGAVVEFFEPPTVPAYGTASGFGLRMLDKTNGTDYQEFDKTNEEFMNNLRPRTELTGPSTFFTANYPHYELVIDNELATQKGVPIKKAMENLDILMGSTDEQGLLRFCNFFKVPTQSAPEFRQLSSDSLNFYVNNDRDQMVHYSAFMKFKNTQGLNEGAMERFRPALMTSLAFIAGVIPLVVATGCRAVGNGTLGASPLGGLGGTLFGTIFGVIIVPGLYFIFGTIAEGKSLIREEEDMSVTEEMAHHV